MQKVKPFDSLQLFPKMTTYSEEVFRKLKKDDLIGIALSLQSKIDFYNAKVKFHTLETDFPVTRKANSLLLSRLVDTKSQYWANSQYSRRETLESVGLPKSLTNDKAETKLCQIFRSLDCNVTCNLDACHWLKDKKRVIVKFCRTKNCDKALKAINDLRKLNTTNLDLPEQLIFINQSLCAYYPLLWSTSKIYMVKAESLVATFRTGQLR